MIRYVGLAKKSKAHIRPNDKFFWGDKLLSSKYVVYIFKQINSKKVAKLSVFPMVS